MKTTITLTLCNMENDFESTFTAYRFEIKAFSGLNLAKLKDFIFQAKAPLDLTAFVITCQKANVYMKLVSALPTTMILHGCIYIGDSNVLVSPVKAKMSVRARTLNYRYVESAVANNFILKF